MKKEKWALSLFFGIKVSPAEKNLCKAKRTQGEVFVTTIREGSKQKGIRDRKGRQEKQRKALLCKGHYRQREIAMAGT